jgi:antitoxin PrlF
MRASSSMTSKGQVTVPKRIRDELGLRPGDSIAFSMENGCVTLRKAYPSLKDLMGSLPAREVPMDEWDEFVQDDAVQHYIETSS